MVCLLHKYGEKIYKEKVTIKGNSVTTRAGYVKKCKECGKEKFEVFYFNKRNRK
jgi:hypothetical protein